MSVTSDLNKGLTQITYNVLGMPETITQQDGSYTRYLYTAAGSKLTEEVYDPQGTQKRTDYVDGYIYQDNALQYIMHAEGRIVPATEGRRQALKAWRKSLPGLYID